MAKCLGYCEEACEDLGLILDCCVSCHEDNDMGLDDLTEIDLDHGFYKVCCRILDSFNERKKNEKVAQAKGK